MMCVPDAVFFLLMCLMGWGIGDILAHVARWLRERSLK
jgi:hypothetical protein